MLTETEIKYIRIVYEFEEKGVPLVGPQDIANVLNVSRASAHESLVRLVRKGYLEHFPRKGFRLSKIGKCVAKRIIRNHRILETMLVKIVGLSVDEACECASGIEFKISLAIIEKIYDKLGNPQCCPHGKPIPPIENECEEVQVKCAPK